MNKIAVIGSGSWGTALSIVLADNGHEVRLWGKNKRIIREINEKHINNKYLPNIILPDLIVGYESFEEAVRNVDVVLLAVPTKAIREIVGKLSQLVKKHMTIVHASKGIEPVTFKRISEIILEEMPNDKDNGIVVLSGPSHAEEVSLRHPTTVTAAAKDIQMAERIQDLFMNHYFRVYTNSDIVGVEIGGSLKNIIALGAGISDGLGYGANAKAALITRGLSEMSKIGIKIGAKPLTFSGLTGIGDLIVTCTSVHSRNWRAGNLLGKGYKLEEVLNNMGMVVEGVTTTEAVYHLSRELNVDMPITSALYEILFNSKCPRQSVNELMNRVGREECLTDK